MNISENGKKLIKKYEGCRLKAYKPVKEEKYWTIGWGHYGADVKANQTITQVEADKMFDSDIIRYVNWVNNKAYCPVVDKLNQNQFDALVSICYNAGPGNLKKLCTGRTVDQIADKISSFATCGANGKQLAGLVRRRKEEQQLFKTNSTNSTNSTTKNEEVAKMVGKTIIKGIQSFLNAVGFNCGSVDGIVGQKTIDAMTKFLKSL